jgi:GalNAc5-diNAcBac-PP-undecaprenol beta-1,3-glucosyltransferase
MKPKVTIIMATYNRADLIVETLESIVKQSFKDWECLIIDDGGTDNTKEVISFILESDERFNFYKRPKKYKKGLPGCRNYGLDLAKGDGIIFFDDDDIVHPDNLKKGLEVLEFYNVDFCHYQKLVYEGQKTIFENKPITIQQNLTLNDIEKVVNQKIGLASCTVLWKKKCFEKVRFNENLLYAEEWECYSRLISEKFNGIIISNVLYYNRKHANSNTGAFNEKNPVLRASYVNALLLIVINLKEKKLLTNNLKRYFISISRDYKEFNLFKALLNTLGLSKFEKFRWQFFYTTFPFRLKLYQIKLIINKRFNS